MSLRKSRWWPCCLHNAYYASGVWHQRRQGQRMLVAWEVRKCSVFATVIASFLLTLRQPASSTRYVDAFHTGLALQPLRGCTSGAKIEKSWAVPSFKKPKGSCKGAHELHTGAAATARGFPVHGTAQGNFISAPPISILIICNCILRD